MWPNTRITKAQCACDLPEWIIFCLFVYHICIQIFKNYFKTMHCLLNAMEFRNKWDRLLIGHCLILISSHRDSLKYVSINEWGIGVFLCICLRLWTLFLLSKKMWCANMLPSIRHVILRKSWGHIKRNVLLTPKIFEDQRSFWHISVQRQLPSTRALKWRRIAC